MFNSDNGIGGFHDDVLSAVPTDDESSLKLIEEIKNRAKGSISSHNYPGAITLYSKAIEVCPSDSLGAKAILYSNRSLCHSSMSNWDLAIDDAEQSIIADPTYMKGYFRKVQGLLQRAKGDDLECAKKEVLHCLSVTPDDKTFIKLLMDVEKKQSQVKSGVVKVEEKKIEKSTVSTVSNVRSTVENKVVKEEVEKSEEEEDKIRGYKLTKDGRKTTFFNNEMDEQTRTLIGDIAPQKISNAAVSAVEGKDKEGSKGGSAWNAAGTFESVDHSTWAVENLKIFIENTEIEKIKSELIECVEIKEVTCEGDAQLIGMRGKRKHVCDITATINWKVQILEKNTKNSDKSTEEILLKMIVKDITADKDYEFEILYPKISPVFTNIHKTELTNYVKNLQIKVVLSLQKFLDAFVLK